MAKAYITVPHWVVLIKYSADSKNIIQNRLIITDSSWMLYSLLCYM